MEKNKEKKKRVKNIHYKKDGIWNLLAYSYEVIVWDRANQK